VFAQRNETLRRHSKEESSAIKHFSFFYKMEVFIKMFLLVFVCGSQVGNKRSVKLISGAT